MPTKKKAPVKKLASSNRKPAPKKDAAAHARIDKIVHNLAKALGLNVEAD